MLPSLTVPLVTVSWPATMRSVEVFPHPEGPSRQQYVLASGPRAGQPVRRLRSAAAVVDEHKARCARLEGFSLHANVALPAQARAGREHLCRYLLRPPLALERLSDSSHGQLLYELAHPRADGATHLLLDPLELLEKLAVLVPAPRSHLLRYHGVLPPHAAWRSLIVPRPDADGGAKASVGLMEPPAAGRRPASAGAAGAGRPPHPAHRRRDRPRNRRRNRPAVSLVEGLHPGPAGPPALICPPAPRPRRPRATPTSRFSTSWHSTFSLTVATLIGGLTMVRRVRSCSPAEGRRDRLAGGGQTA
jgi:Putative transposase